MSRRQRLGPELQETFRPGAVEEILVFDRRPTEWAPTGSMRPLEHGRIRCGLCDLGEIVGESWDPRRWRLSLRHGTVHAACFDRLRLKIRRRRLPPRTERGRFVSRKTPHPPPAPVMRVEDPPGPEPLAPITGPLGLSNGRRAWGLPLFVRHPVHGLGRVVGPERRGRPTRVPVRIGDFPRPEVHVAGIGFGWIDPRRDDGQEWTTRHLPLKELAPA